LKFFFDNNLSPHLAHGVRELSNTHWPKAQNVIRWWPAIVEQASRITGGAAFRVPWKFSGKGKFEQIRFD
jgi:hypothetical protein